MKKRIWGLGIAVFTGCVLLAGASFTVAQSPEPPDEVKIENEGYKADRMGPVPFSHKKHVEEYQVKCDACHHQYSDGENVWKLGDPVKKCVECHNPLKEEVEGLDLKKAFHDNCRNCHKEAVAKGNTNAPDRKCMACHVKE
jgi:hypothetical protein